MSYIGRNQNPKHAKNVIGMDAYGISHERAYPSGVTGVLVPES